MRAPTMQRLTQAIQLLWLDGYDEFKISHLSQVSGLSSRTLERNKDIIDILNFVLTNGKGYERCYL